MALHAYGKKTAKTVSKKKPVAKKSSPKKSVAKKTVKSAYGY